MKRSFKTCLTKPLLAQRLNDQLINFLDEDLSPDLSFLEEHPRDETLLSELAEEDSPPSFSDQELEQPALSEPEPPLADISNSSPKSFQEQQALDDFFADDPLADFLPHPVQPPGEEFLEGGLSEPMAAATAQDYFNSPEPGTDFQPESLNSVPPFQPELEDEQDILDGTFQPESDQPESGQPGSEPTDLFSERMDSLEAEFPQDFQPDPLDQPDRDFLSDDDAAASLDNWDGALENPLPDVEINQADTISSLESLTDDADLDDPERTHLQTEHTEVQTEAWFAESSDRHPEEESTIRQERQPNRWDLDLDEEPAAIDNPLPSTVRALRGSPTADALLEDLTVSLPNLPDDDYEQHVAYPSLNDPTQAPPQPKRSPWIFPLVLLCAAGWILALVGFSYWLKERDTRQPPTVEPSAGSPAPSIPPAPTDPASPSSALPDSEDSATALPENTDWLAVD
jgi:hypothetical protein